MSRYHYPFYTNNLQDCLSHHSEANSYDDEWSSIDLEKTEEVNSENSPNSFSESQFRSQNECFSSRILDEFPYASSDHRDFEDDQESFDMSFDSDIVLEGDLAVMQNNQESFDMSFDSDIVLEGEDPVMQNDQEAFDMSFDSDIVLEGGLPQMQNDPESFDMSFDDSEDIVLDDDFADTSSSKNDPQAPCDFFFTNTFGTLESDKTHSNYANPIIKQS